jgi:hypothetical protein
MAHDVFISYAQNDKPTADAACHGLESAGIRCWIAPRDVPAGSNWKTQLVEAIRHARLMVLVFSSEADRSPQVMREVDIAFESGAPIVPFRIEDVKMSDEMYYCIAARHWLDALNPPLEEHIARLTADVRAILAARPVTSDAVSDAVSDPPRDAGNAPPPRPQSIQDTQAPGAFQPVAAPALVPLATAAPDRSPAAIPLASGGAQAGAPSPSTAGVRTIGLMVIAGSALVASGLALRHWIGNEYGMAVEIVIITVAAGVFFLARGRRAG